MTGCPRPPTTTWITLATIVLLAGATAASTGIQDPTRELDPLPGPGGPLEPVPITGHEPLSGQALWEQRYDGPVGGSDWGRGVAVHPEGLLVFVTGNSQQSSTGGAEFATLAYEATTGLPIWESRWDGSDGASDFPNAIGVDPTGSRVYVSGYSGDFSDLDYATLAYDALTGLLLWEARYDGPGPGQDVVYDLAVDPAGERIYVTGGSAGPDGDRDFATVSYDAATGDELWDSRYAGSAGGFDNAWAITTDGDGDRVFVTGQAREGSPDIVTVAYDAETGDELWVTRIDGPAGSFDNANDLVVHPDGDTLFVAGYTRTVAQSNDLSVIALDAGDGQELWRTLYDSGAARADYANQITIGPDGDRVYATGYSWGGSATRADWATLALDTKTGGTEWVARYDGPGSGLDAGEAVEVSMDGARVYVTGYSEGESSRDYATTAYDATNGGAVWTARHDGGSTDHPRALAVDPLELRVYVTGYSRGGSNDFTTIAYLDLH